MENIKVKEDRYYECGKGWEPLILQAEAIVEQYNIEHPNLEQPIEFTQIKEKFGYLNLYLNHYPDDLLDKMLELSSKSREICEICGKPAKTFKLHGWLYTYCDECKQKEKERWENIFNKK